MNFAKFFEHCFSRTSGAYDCTFIDVNLNHDSVDLVNQFFVSSF